MKVHLCCGIRLNRAVCSRTRLISGGQRRVGAFAQRAGERGGQTQPSRGRERAAQAEDHRGGDFQTGAAQRAGEDQRGERAITKMLFDREAVSARGKTFAFMHTALCSCVCRCSKGFSDVHRKQHHLENLFGAEQ